MAITVAKLEAILTADTDQYDRSLDKADSKMGKVGGAIGKAALGAGVVLGAGIAVGAKKAVDAASNLGESINAVNVVFGKASKQVLAFGEGAAKKTGLSMRQFNELVTPIGASMMNMGDSADVAASKSIKLAQRAADMASVFNVDVKDALGAIQAGLRGEADPLERFGVGLSEAAVKSKAMAMGLAETEKGLTAADKAQARYALLMEQTNKVQGDFANTSGSLANAKRILGAELENVAAKIGTALLPVLSKIVSLIATEVIPFVSMLGEKLVGFLGPAFEGVAQAAERNVDKVRSIMAAVFSWVQDNIFPIIVSLKEIWVDMVNNIRDVLAANGPELERIFGRVGAAMKLLWAVIGPALRILFVEILPVAIGILITAIDKATQAVEGVIRVFGWIRDHTAPIWNLARGAAVGAADLIRGAMNLLDAAIDRIQAGFVWARDVGAAIWGAVREAANPAINAIKDAINLLDAALDKVRAGFSWLRDHAGIMDRVWDAVKRPLGLIVDGFKDLLGILEDIVNVFKWLRDHVGGILDKVGGFIGGAVSKLPGRGDIQPPALAAPGGGAGGGPNPRLVAFGRFAQSLGYQVGEHPAFGGVYPVHNHYGPPDHYHGGALDINADGFPGGEAPALDRLSAIISQWFGSGRLTPWGPGVIWRSAGHFNHLHVSAHDQGGWSMLKPGLNLMGNFTGRDEPMWSAGRGGAPATVVNFNFPNLVATSKQELMSWIQNANAEFKRRNGRGLMGT